EPMRKSETFPEELSPNEKKSNADLTERKLQPAIDTYAEWDTWDTINAVKNALECYHDVTLIEADSSAMQNLKEIRPDIVFNIAEGFNGVSREAQIPAILDMLQIPYSGSDPLTLSTCLDKARTKEILSYHKIPNSKFFVAEGLNQTLKHSLNYPLMVKPVSEGSSKGIFLSSFVRNDKELNKEAGRILNEYGQPALVEEFLPGREFTVAIIGNGSEAEVLPIVEINYEEFPDDFTPIYSYEAKWIIDTKENPLEVFTCPAKINTKLEEKIKAAALNAYHVLRCRDWSRIDVRLNAAKEPNIIEINPLPGILPDVKENSCFPKAARTAGLGYSEMINKVLYVAAKRHNLI
ncbi:MAG TPA: ATP-grasp domain-containing protein, partial [Ignavibacteriaceae bacterium]|nr:ATP-grasp domain-containing protein [Ignavibacteriaceae bacterium]